MDHQVHQYKNNGYNIVLDVNSGAVHVVDDVVYDVLALYETCTEQEIAERLKGTYPANEVSEAYEELTELKEAGELFTKDEYRDYIFDFKNRQTVVKAICQSLKNRDCF